jgi:MOSC domain-containing protein YiiM
MKQVGQVLSLYIASTSQHKNVNKIQLTPLGIINDKHYNKNNNRSILITSIESYEKVKNHNIDIENGALGENILVSFNPYQLPVGTQLKINHTILEITENCTLCNHLSKIDKQLPKLIKKDRGIFAKIIFGGEIEVNHSIYLVKTNE